MGCLFMLHNFISMEFSMEFTHITVCEIEDFFVNEGGGMLIWKSALNQKPYIHQTSQHQLHKYKRIESYSIHEEVKLYKVRVTLKVTLLLSMGTKFKSMTVSPLNPWFIQYSHLRVLS